MCFKCLRASYFRCLPSETFFFIIGGPPLPHERTWFRPNGYFTGTAPREITWECFSVNGSWCAQEAVQQSLLRYAMDRGKQWAESNSELTQIHHCFGKLDRETNWKNPNIGLQCHVIMCSHDYTSLYTAEPTGRDFQALICLTLQSIWFHHCYRICICGYGLTCPELVFQVILRVWKD